MAFALTLALASAGPGRAADEPPASATAPARVAQCAECHGPDGNSRTPGVPSLAGQPAEFLLEQLAHFRTGRRSFAPMQAVALALSEAEAASLAAHYSRLPARTSGNADADADLMSKGRALAALRTCGSCHRSRFEGGGRVPRLAGQREDYLRASLLAYREQLRASPERVMVAIMDQVPDGHIQALAHFLAHQP